MRPKVGLVLGAGSARGIAHLGVLQVFLEQQIPVDVVVGCSAGAIVGALFAAGVDLYLVEKLLRTYPVMKQLVDVGIPRTGFVKGERVLEFLRLLTKDLSFEDLPVKLAVVATDLEKGEQVVFAEGKIAPAVRASISIPGVFCPYNYQGMTLVDGAVIERLPVAVAKTLGSQYIIGVDVKRGREARIKNVFDVMTQSVEIMEEEIFRRTVINTDVLIQPEVSHIGSFRFDLAEEAVRLGREAALRQLPEIQRALLPSKYYFGAKRKGGFMKVLVINCGSSSLKYQLFDMTDRSVLAKGLVERIGIPGSFLTHRRGAEKTVIEQELPTHDQAISLVLNALTNPEYGVISNLNEISAVGHRVLHGGEKFTASTLVNDEVMEAVRDCIELGPLHNPANIMGIEACQKLMPGVPQVAVFDTAFHQTMPPESYIYGLPYEMYEKHRIRRYGFHGTSHRYVSMRAIEILGKPVEETRIITCHLGNGASLAAVKGGKVVDTSMGLTPLEGLVMGTRCGSIDPAIVPLLMKKENLTPDEVDTLMNKKSGVLGISGLSSDFRDLQEAAAQGNSRAQLALDIFAHVVRKHIGAYAAVLGGADAIVFTAGLGENSAFMRAKIAQGLEFMGIEIDELKNNDVNGSEVDIATDKAGCRVLVIPTNEELMIALDTEEITGR